MSEIPEDVKQTARELVELQSVWLRDKPHETCAELIARAILAERNRCAEKARAYLKDIGGRDLHDDEPDRIFAALQD